MKGKTASESHVHRGQPAALPSVRGARSVSRDAARRTVPGPSTGSGCGSASRDGAGGQEEADEDYGHVHQEHGPPAGPEHVCRDEDAAQDLAGDHGQARRRPVQAHGLRPAPARRRRLDGGEDLREHRGRRGALRDARGHKGPGVGGEAAGQRGQAEGDHAAEEQPAPAEEVAEPSAEDEQDGVRESVTGDDEFEERLARGGRGRWWAGRRSR